MASPPEVGAAGALLAHVPLRECAGIEIPHQKRSCRSSITAVSTTSPRLSIGRNSATRFLVGRVTAPTASSLARMASAPSFGQGPQLGDRLPAIGDHQRTSLPHPAEVRAKTHFQLPRAHYFAVHVVIMTTFWRFHKHRAFVISRFPRFKSARRLPSPIKRGELEPFRPAIPTTRPCDSIDIRTFAANTLVNKSETRAVTKGVVS